MAKETAARAGLGALQPVAVAGTAAPVAPSGVKGVEVYKSDFGKAAGAEWSKTTVTKSPSGKHTFLGPFSNESITLSLGDLPEHSRVRLSFDLMIIMTWDGDLYLDEPQAHPEGPDLFDVTVDRGPRLVHASFVARPSSAEWTQSFPGVFPTTTCRRALARRRAGRWVTSTSGPAARACQMITSIPSRDPSRTAAHP